MADRAFLSWYEPEKMPVSASSMEREDFFRQNYKIAFKRGWTECMAKMKMVEVDFKVSKPAAIPNKNVFAALDKLILKAINRNHRHPAHTEECLAEAEKLRRANLVDVRGMSDIEIVNKRHYALKCTGKVVYLRKADAPKGRHGWYTVKK